MIYNELRPEYKKSFDQCITLIENDNLKNFIKLLGTKDNYILTNIIQPSLISETIRIEGLTNSNKQKFAYAIFLYSLLSETIQQTEAGSNIKRFQKIKQITQNFLENAYSIVLYPKMVKTILSKSYNERIGDFRDTNSCYWYLLNKVILKNKILNTSLKESLLYFLNKLKISMLNLEFENVKEILANVPFVYAFKNEDGEDIAKFAQNNLDEESIKTIQNLIKLKEK